MIFDVFNDGSMTAEYTYKKKKKGKKKKGKKGKKK